MNGEVQFGRYCYLPDNRINPASSCLGAEVLLGINLQKTTDNFFSIKLRGLELQNIIGMFGTEAQATAFKSKLPKFMHEETGFPVLGASYNPSTCGCCGC